MRSSNDGHTEKLHGKLPEEEFGQLSSLLEAPDFRNPSGNGGGLIRQDAETFAGEIAVRADGTLMDTARNGSNLKLGVCNG